MSKHYSNLHGAADHIDTKLDLNALTKIKLFDSSSVSYIKKMKRLINYKIKKNIIMLHFDEKWDLSNRNKDEIEMFLKTLFEIKNAIIIVTKGVSLNKYDKFNFVFYNKVQKGFIKLANSKKKSYMIINSNSQIKKNKELILNKINKLI